MSRAAGSAAAATTTTTTTTTTGAAGGGGGSPTAAVFLRERRAAVPPPIAAQLDALVRRLQCAAEDVYRTWEVIALEPGSAHASDDYPRDESAVAALAKALEREIKRREAARRHQTVAAAAGLQPVLNKDTVRAAVAAAAAAAAAASSSGSPQMGSAAATSWVTPPKKRGAATPADLGATPQSKEARTAVTPTRLGVFNAGVRPAEPGSARPLRVQRVPLRGGSDGDGGDRAEPTAEDEDDALYMRAPAEDLAETTRAALSEFGRRMLAHVAPARQHDAPAGSDPAETTPAVAAYDAVGASMQGRNVLVCGRVVSDAENGKLTFATAMLEGANGVRVRLDFKNYRAGRVSLFPGQFAVVEGSCAHYGGGKTVMVERLYGGEAWPPPSASFPGGGVGTGVSMWVASGPFTSAADLTFDALAQLMADVAADAPGLLVLVGPFVDASHPAVASGRPTVRALRGASAPASAEDQVVSLDAVMREFLKRLQAWLRAASPVTKVVLVPSTDDAPHPVPCYPQPALDLDAGGAVIKPDMRRRILSVPNPCAFRVEAEPEPSAEQEQDRANGGTGTGTGTGGGVVVGVSNADALKHFFEEGSPALGYEFSENFARLAAQWTAQRCFYPLAPPPPEACVEPALRDRYRMPPLDVLVAPSVVHQNAAVDTPAGILCVNPGRGLVSKTRMTVAKIWVPADAGVVAKRARVEFNSLEVVGNAAQTGA